MMLGLWRKAKHQRLVSEIDVEDLSISAKDLDAEEHLVSWLRIRGEYDACSGVTLCSQEGIRTLVAKRDIKAGECVFRVSHRTMMTPECLPPEFHNVIPEGMSEWAQLALLLLFEKRAGKASTWAPFISCLPKWGSIHSTAFWRKEELALIKESSLSFETRERRDTMRDEFADLQQIFDKFEDAFGGRVSYATFKHAYVTVCSRAWRIPGLKKLAIIPVADYLSHDSNTEAVLRYNSKTCYAELIADRNYAAGEQLVINYGPLSNSCLALDFGFTLPYNPWDKVEIWLGISGRDKLREEKLQHLHSIGLPTLTYPDGSDTGGMSFTLREVRYVTGDGKEFPQSLFTMAQIICATEVDEFQTRNPAEDDRVLTLLLNRMEAFIQQHVNANLVLQARKRNSVSGESTTLLCLEMAEAVLGGELRVLRSASAWLKHRLELTTSTQ